MVFQDIAHRKTGSSSLHYQCSCNLAKMQNALFSLGRQAIRDLSAKEEGVEVCCEFCRQSYLFSKQDLEKLLGAVTK